MSSSSSNKKKKSKTTTPAAASSSSSSKKMNKNKKCTSSSSQKKKNGHSLSNNTITSTPSDDLQSKFQQVLIWFSAILVLLVAYIIASSASSRNTNENVDRNSLSSTRSKSSTMPTTSHVGASGTTTPTTTTSSSSSSLEYLFNLACNNDNNHDVKYCVHEYSLVTTKNRTMYSNRYIPRDNIRLLEIKRTMQIVDIDALRDPFIQQENNLLQVASHPSISFSTAPYLAVYLANLINQIKKKTSSSSSSMMMMKIDPVLRAYLEYLPTYEDYVKFHPQFLDENFLKLHLGGEHSFTYQMIMEERNKFRNEYETFVAVANVANANANAANANESPDGGSPPPSSSSFVDTISLEDYLVARIHVTSRAFTSRGLTQDDYIYPGEKEYYQSIFGNGKHTDGMFGRRVMVPIVDSFNHKSGGINHANVQYDHDPISKSYFVTSNGKIEFGEELFDSYGSSKPDSTMFVKYGFVTGDGLTPLVSSIAAFHYFDYDDYTTAATVTTTDSEQLKQLVQYLSYDDGYETCIINMRTPQEGEEEESYNNTSSSTTFKKLKFELLKMISKNAKYWTVTFPSPKKKNQQQQAKTSSLSLSSFSFEIPDTTSSSLEYYYDYSSIIRVFDTTCKLLAMTHRDYNGKATMKLRMLLRRMKQYEGGATTLELEDDSNNPSLQFRSAVWLRRLSKIQYDKYNLTTSSLQEEIERVVVSSSSSSLLKHQSPEWNMAHVRLGELLVLYLVEKYASQRLIQSSIQDVVDHQILQSLSEEDYLIRDQPCPMSNMDFLFE